MCEECAALRERVDALEARIDALEADDRTTSTSGFGDHRDQSVLGSLDVGQRVSVESIRRRYRTHTDVVNDRTVKKRTKNLLKSGPFDRDGSAWVYRGEADE